MLWAGQKTEDLSKPVQLNLEKYNEESDSDTLTDGTSEIENKWCSDTVGLSPVSVLTDATSEIVNRWYLNTIGRSPMRLSPVSAGAGALGCDVCDGMIDLGDEKVLVAGMLFASASLASSTTFLDPALLITNTTKKFECTINENKQTGNEQTLNEDQSDTSNL
eukprot:UN25470